MSFEYGVYRLDHLKCDQSFHCSHRPRGLAIWMQRIESKRGHRWCELVAWFTPINTCDLCGMRSTPKRVQSRSDVWGWNFIDNRDFSANAREGSKHVLCMSCWNRVRPIVRSQRIADEIKRANTQLQRAYREQRRNTTQGENS